MLKKRSVHERFLALAIAPEYIKIVRMAVTMRKSIII